MAEHDSDDGLGPGPMTGLASRLAERPPWLVRFPHLHGESVAGAGVLIGARHVVTCAHVLEKQLGRPLPVPGLGLAERDEAVEFAVEFPFSGEPGTTGTRMRARLMDWVPIAADESGDVALLELDSSVDCIPAPLACPPALSGHRFSVHGFPHGDLAARQATGVLRGASGREGPWVQLDAKSSAGWAIEVGFSGSPVFDHSREAVVGIVVMRDKHRTGHMLPMSYLRTLWPEVRTNCRWRLDLDESYRSHWRPRARGLETDSGTAEWFFTGRTEARRVICDWLKDMDPALAEHPILLVTGGPGTGKSALLAHSLVSSDPLLAETVPRPDPRRAWAAGISDPRPPIGSFNAALHLKGRTCDEAAAQLARGLGIDASDSDELLAAIGELPLGEKITVLADAVEEAADLKEALRIATLLRQLATTGRVRVLASVRTAPAGTSRARILNNFGRSAPRIDLEDSRYLHRPDIADYVVQRLSSERSGSARYHAYESNQRQAVGEAVARKARYNFLIAQLTTGWLIRRSTRHPELDDPSWEDELPETVGQALDAYLDACGTDTETIRRLLTALAYARGDGLPRSDTWLYLADALGFGVCHSAEDREKIFQSAAHYLVERVNDGAGTPTYRLYHDALDQHLREEYELVHHAPEAAITAALVDAVPERDGHRDWVHADAYTRDHLASHAAAAGQLDTLITDAEYLVHAAPRNLVPHLYHRATSSGQLSAAVYRTSLGIHASTAPGVRRHVLALDAARAGATALHQQLIHHIPEGDWAPLWATGGTFSPALRGTMTGHTFEVLAVACTVLDGSPVAVTGGADGTVRVWDLRTSTLIGQPLTNCKDKKVKVACTVLDGSPVAVTGDADGTVRVWDLRTSTLIGQPLAADRGYVFAVACTVLDGIPVAVTGGGTVAVWDLRTGTLIRRFSTGHTGAVTALACTVLDGSPVAVTGSSSGRDGTARVWDLRTGNPIGRPLAGHSGAVLAVACTVLDGAPVAVTGGGLTDGTVRVWDLRTGNPIGQPLAGHTRVVSAVACTVLDGTPIAVTGGSPVGTVRVWDVRTGKPIGQPLATPTGVTGAACTVLDGAPVAVTGGYDGTVRVWDLRTGPPIAQPLAGHTGKVLAVACTVLDGTPIAVTGSNEHDGTVQVWDLRTGNPIGRPLAGHTGAVLAVACTVLDGTPIAVTQSSRTIDATVRAWDLRTGIPIGPPFDHTGDGRSVACTVLDGAPVAVTGGYDGTVQVWDLRTGNPIGPPLGHNRGGGPVACTVLDGSPVAVTGGGTVWDLRTGTLISEFAIGHKGAVYAVACTVLDGSPVAVTGGDDGLLRVWNLRTGTLIGRPLIGHTGQVWSVACTIVDGVPIAVADIFVSGRPERELQVGVWDLRTGKPAGFLAVTNLGSVAGSPDGDLVLGLDHDIAVFRRGTTRPR
ncbi:hypothetical protein ACWGKQ_15970 [Streptomyces sp. NPDC054770]